MPLREIAKASAPTHWSKDFVEHLRTVHFTLIGLAIGLIVIVLSAKPYDSVVALRQLHEILELKKLWTVEWLMQRGEKNGLPLQARTPHEIRPVRNLAQICLQSANQIETQERM